MHLQCKTSTFSYPILPYPILTLRGSTGGWGGIYPNAGMVLCAPVPIVEFGVGAFVGDGL